MTATDQDAGFIAFVQAHTGSLHHTAYLLTGNRQAADDLLQDALLKTWLAWRKIDQRAAWAYTRKVMVNLTTDRWRRRRYEAITIDIDERRRDPGGEAGFEGVEDRAFIVRQLAGLTPHERAMVVLRYYADLSETEIADVLGCRPGTVKSLASRALATLSKEIHR